MSDAFGPPVTANDSIDLDTPVRLDDAVRLFFPYGGMTVSGLRREAQRGRLIVEKIANKQFTTRRAIEGMRELCRVKVGGLIFGGEKSAAKAARLSPKERGLLSTMVITTPQDALLARIAKHSNV